MPVAGVGDVSWSVAGSDAFGLQIEVDNGALTVTLS